MKFKKIILISTLLFVVLTISAVSATADNVTTELTTVDEEIPLESDNHIVNEEISLESDSNMSNEEIIQQSNGNEISDGNITVKIPSKTIQKPSNETTYSLEIVSYNYGYNGIRVKYNVTNPIGESKIYYSTLNEEKACTFTAPVNIMIDEIGIYNITISRFQYGSWKNYNAIGHITVTEPPVKTAENNNAVQSDNTDYRTNTHLKAPSTKVKYKSNSYFKINHYWWSYYSSKEPIQNSKISLTVWTGKKTKTYKLTTNRKGIAKFNTKKLKIGTHKVKITFKGDDNYKGASIFSKIIVKKTLKKKITKKTTKKKKSSSKYKIITTKAKFHKITKKSGKYKVETCIYDFSVGIRAQYKCIDILLYKNGKQIRGNKYFVKYKLNGKWTGWTKHGIYETCHQRHYVKDSVRVSQIKIKVNKKCNSFV